MATALSKAHTLKNVPEALKIYDEVRRPFSQHIQRLSLRTGISQLMTKTGEVPVGETFEYGELEDDPEVLRQYYGWSWTTSVMPDRDRTLEMCQERIS